MPRVWRLIAHHEMANEAVEWSIKTGRIAVGWGQIGDLRELAPTSSSDITNAIRSVYPELQNAQLGGPSLWNLLSEMAVGDRVILTGTRRLCVMEVTGPYVYTSLVDTFGTGHYQHQRSAVLTEEDPDLLWASCGGRVVEGENVRWAVALCAQGGEPSPRVAPERLLEGARYELVASAVERNPAARRACIDHHGARCAVCDLDFGERYGDIGTGFIHVHHLEPLALSEGDREVDPVRDLVPLCPNCHAMSHRRLPPFTVAELRERLSKASASLA